jgi:hypothetical protein
MRVDSSVLHASVVLHPRYRFVTAAEVTYLGSSEVGYSLRVRDLLGAGSRAASPLRFSVIFEYGGLFREYAPSLIPSCLAPAGIPARQRIGCRSGSECWIAGGQPLV